MPLTHIPAQIALSKITGLVVAGGTGVLYAFNDAGFVNPLQARNGAGDPIPTPNSNASGRIPEFWVDISDQDPGIYWVANGTDPTFVYSVNGFRGKSAYQHASEGGYPNTEATFNLDLANVPVLAQNSQDSADSAAQSAASAQAAAGLVGAPASSAVAAAIGEGGGARDALDAAIIVETAGKLDTMKTVTGARNLQHVLNIVSSATTGTFQLVELKDDASHAGHLLNLEHYGANPSSFGINLANWPGAERPFVIHQYSGVGNAFHIDNTDAAPSINIWNTENQVRNPGNHGTGPFIRLKPWQGTGFFDLRDDLTFENNTQHDVAFESNGGAPSMTVKQNGQALGMTVSTVATGLWSLVVTAPAFGMRVNSNGGAAGQTLLVDQSAVGGLTTALQINNKGSGDSIAIRDPANALVAKIASNGVYENTVAGAGIILKSLDGSRWQMGVSNLGETTWNKL